MMSTELLANGLSELPNEILLRIFTLVVCEESQSSSYAQAPAPAWVLSIPHVCSRWRTLALGSPTLWTRITSYFHFFWYNVHLERAHDTPLHPIVPLLDADDIPDEGLLENMARASCEMDIILQPGPLSPQDDDEEEDDEGDAYFVWCLGDDAPRLQTLSIEQPSSTVPLELPHPFSNNHDSLRHLSITCPSLEIPNWTTNLFTNLTSLTIHSTVNFSVLRAICRKATKLERLAYSAPSPRGKKLNIKEPFIRDERPLVMPSLHELSMSSFDQRDSESFLAALELPALERLYLRLRVTSASSKAAVQLVEDLTPLLRSFADPTHVEFLIHDDKRVAFVLGRSPIDVPSVVIVFDLIEKLDVLALFPRLLSHFALDSVRTLGLADATLKGELYEASVWRELLQPFKGVTELWCMQATHQITYSSELLSALWPGQWAPYTLPAETEGELILPSLRRMNFTRRPVRFAGLREPGAVAVHEQWPSDPDEPHPFELLRLADRIGRLSDAKRAVEYVFEDVEGMEGKVREMLRRGEGREVEVVTGSRVVSLKAA
ncbi:hypothetical protein PENSPDRAFT_652944 [Peniophora sp. CONT]|nr:hypothetical protein PENSPDRAFT_652944 [Peniophora sp. CONT]